VYPIATWLSYLQSESNRFKFEISSALTILLAKNNICYMIDSIVLCVPTNHLYMDSRLNRMILGDLSRFLHCIIRIPHRFFDHVHQHKCHSDCIIVLLFPCDIHLLSASRLDPPPSSLSVSKPLPPYRYNTMVLCIPIYLSTISMSNVIKIELTGSKLTI
jgi:hypothetical protein